ncbi:MAG: AsnC family transcriptional regulator [Methanopyri archaeon]|jgi:DNA-binding Lrp family transcriptional regulator|nr:AsnC family transcriptional regulator [Methanopyri archaeon]
MEPQLDGKDVALLRATQDGIPLVPEPFRDIARATGLREAEVMSRLKRLKENGVIRRFGASINHRRVGIVANALVAWEVPQNRVEDVGEAFAGNERVTHCILRGTVPGRWSYNLFTVLHGRDRSTVEDLVQKMSDSTGIANYLILFSTRQFKKTSNGRIVERAIAAITEEVDRTLSI